MKHPPQSTSGIVAVSLLWWAAAVAAFGQAPAPEIRAESTPGQALAARVAAADAACAASCTISVNRADRVDAATTVRPGHSLLFRAPVVIAAPIVLSGSQTLACTAGTALSFTGKDAGIRIADGAADVAVHDCTATGSGQDMVVLAGNNSRITISGITATGFHIAFFACQPHARSGGTGWDIHLCHDIRYLNNTVNASTAAAMQFESVSGGEIAGNTVTHASEGIYLNGGEADPNHGLYRFGTDGLSHIAVHGNTVRDVDNGCIWASVSSDIEFRENRVSHCGDVAIDFEGVTGGRSIRNVIADAGRRGGALSAFFKSSDITFSGDAVTAGASPTTGPVIWIHNSTNDPAFTGPIRFSGITANAQAGVVPANFESLHGLTIDSSSFTNVQLSMPLRYNGLVLRNNQFRYSTALPGDAAVSVGVSLYGGTDSVVGNNFVSSVPQPAGLAALSMRYGDFNASEQFEVSGNTFAPAFPVALRIDHHGANPGVGSRWILRGNTWSRPPEIHNNGVGAFHLEQPGG